MPLEISREFRAEPLASRFSGRPEDRTATPRFNLCRTMGGAGVLNPPRLH
jgi:hypothetical protein